MKVLSTLKNSTILVMTFFTLSVHGQKTVTHPTTEGTAAPQDSVFIEPVVQDKSEKIQLTVYHDLAFIRDQRTVTLTTGKNRFAFQGVSREMIPTTLLTRILQDTQSIAISEETFQLEPFHIHKMIDQHIGLPVDFIAQDPLTGKRKEMHGILLETHPNGTVTVEMDGKIQCFSNAHFLLHNEEHKIFGQPTVLATVEALTATRAHVEFSYLTPGISWSASYTAEVNENDDTVDFLGVTQVRNNTLVRFKDADVGLVWVKSTPTLPKPLSASSPGIQPLAKEAVAPEKAADQIKGAEGGALQGEQTPKEAPPLPRTPQVPQIKPSNLQGHHYIIQQPVSIGPKETKNIPLAHTSHARGERQFWLVINVPYERDANGMSQNLPVTTMISITNDKTSGLGTPLPRGDLLVYHKKGEGTAKISDFSKINHTPVDGKIPLRLGDAEDIQATVQQTDFKKLNHRVFEVGYRVILKNSRNKPVFIRVLKEVRSGDITVLRENHSHRKENGLLWGLNVSAKDQQELRYRLRVVLPEED